MKSRPQVPKSLPRTSRRNRRTKDQRGTIQLHKATQTWYWQYYDYSGKERKRKSVRVGTIAEFPTSVEVWKEVEEKYLHLANGRRRKKKVSFETHECTAEMYQQMWDEQQGKCAICSATDEKLVVDHCHSTGLIRGLLCGLCNRGIGMLKDDPAILLNAIVYLKR